MRSTSDGVHSMLLLTQQILVCFLLLPNSCARDQSRIWSATCLSLVSAVAQMLAFTANFGHLLYGYVYTL